VEYPFIPSDSVFLMRSVITSDFQQNSIKPPQMGKTSLKSPITLSRPSYITSQH